MMCHFSAKHIYQSFKYAIKNLHFVNEIYTAGVIKNLWL